MSSFFDTNCENNDTTISQTYLHVPCSPGHPTLWAVQSNSTVKSCTMKLYRETCREVEKKR